jgi:hypothetical protein
MPVESYFELDTPRHARLTSTASEHTRYLRLTATVAPYINNGVAAAPRLGWKSNEVSLGARVIAPIYGKVLAFLPNRR